MTIARTPYDDLPVTLTAELAEAGLDPERVHAMVADAFEEDLPGGGDDVTSAAVPSQGHGAGGFVAREPGVVAGLAIAELAFVYALGDEVELAERAPDGSAVEAGDTVLRVEGPLAGLLTAERTALNFACHLSGVATTTSHWVAALEGTNAQVLDTRKTLPGWRALQKYAVRCGGGVNHRFSLSDRAMVKDNHVVAAGGVVPAYRAVVAANPGLRVEVEVTDLDQLRELLDVGCTEILLDDARRAVEMLGLSVTDEQMRASAENLPSSEAAKTGGTTTTTATGSEPAGTRAPTSDRERRRDERKRRWTPGVKRALFVVVMFFVFQQITGINVPFYYGPKILEPYFGVEGGSELDAAIMAVQVTAIMSAVNVIATYFAFRFIDKIGRRRLAIAGFAGMGAFMLLGAFGDGFLSGVAKIAVVLIALDLFIASFAVGVGGTGWLIQGEVFPTSVRGRAAAIGATADWLANFVLILVFPLWISAIGLSWVMVCFAALCLLAIAFVAAYLPETKGLSVEEVTRVFDRAAASGILTPSGPRHATPADDERPPRRQENA